MKRRNLIIVTGYARLFEIEPTKSNDELLKNITQMKHPKYRPKAMVVITAVIAAVLLAGAGVSNAVGGWLSENTRWGVEDGILYTVQEKDGVIMKTHCDPETQDFIFEFTGANSAYYTDDGESITIYATKSDDAVYAMVISENIMYTAQALDKKAHWDGMRQALESEEIDIATAIQTIEDQEHSGENIISSKPIELIVVED